MMKLQQYSIKYRNVVDVVDISYTRVPLACSHLGVVLTIYVCSLC